MVIILTWFADVYRPGMDLCRCIQGEFHNKGGTAFGGAGHLDAAAMTLNNPIDNGQTQAGAFPGRLGGKKRVENLIPDRSRDSTASIRKSQNHPVFGSVRLAGDSNPPSAPHGIRRIQQQIGKNLMQLTRIADDLGEVRVQLLYYFNIMKQSLVFNQIDTTADDAVRIKEGSLFQGLTAKFQQAGDNFFCTGKSG